MAEAEKVCERREDIEDLSLYVQSTAALMRSMKALLNLDGIACVKILVQDTLNLANQDRLSISWASRLTSFPFGASLANARRMTIEQLHAELVYTECLFAKAILEGLSCGDWMSFLREALNIRSVVATYRTLHAVIDEHDEDARAGRNPSTNVGYIDEDFRSGVYFGLGLCLLVFSMIPSRIVFFTNLLGYKGNRSDALRLLRKAGGWGTDEGPDHTQRVPRISKEQGGVWRPLCDLAIVIFHLVLSDYTREGVDVKEAENIVEWNLEQYPDSVFFLFGKGRLHVIRSQPDLAIKVYEHAKAKITDQEGYEQLGSVLLRETALCHLALGQWRESAACWGQMKEMAKWSKVRPVDCRAQIAPMSNNVICWVTASIDPSGGSESFQAVCTYGRAACLLQAGDLSQEEATEVNELMQQVPHLLQRIAGKSIPLQKFVARKAKRYMEEGKLVAPALELAYLLQAANRTTDEALAKHAHTLKGANSLDEDDRQLVNLLLAATYRHIDFPDSEDINVQNEKQQLRLNTAESTPKAHEEETMELLLQVKESGPKLKQEHWVAYFAHYELGRLYETLGRYSDARRCFVTVASGSSLEGPSNPRKGKYSLQNTVMFRASSSIATLPITPRDPPRSPASIQHPVYRPLSESFISLSPSSMSRMGEDGSIMGDDVWVEQKAPELWGKRNATHGASLWEGHLAPVEQNASSAKAGEDEKKEEIEAKLKEEDGSPGSPENSQNQSFYPDNNRPRPFLPLTQLDNELLNNIQELNVPVLHGAIWRPNSDGLLCGGFGYIERATWNNQDIAVKFLRGPQTTSGVARGKKSFRRELSTWLKLDHPNILPFLGVVCVDNVCLGMASPYMTNGDARRYITRNPEANILQILYDVAAGLRHLAAQEPPIAHGDLKGTNVLIDQDCRARICDFGLSRFMVDFNTVGTASGGTLRWMAPEQLVSATMLVSLPADIFSWGMLALELMTDSVPWPEVQQDNAIVIKVAINNERPNRPTCKTQRCQKQPKCVCLIGDDVLWGLIQQCWLSERDGRPTATQLCKVLAQDPTIKPCGNSQETPVPKPLILSDSLNTADAH